MSEFPKLGQMQGRSFVGLCSFAALSAFTFLRSSLFTFSNAVPDSVEPLLHLHAVLVDAWRGSLDAHIFIW